MNIHGYEPAPAEKQTKIWYWIAAIAIACIVGAVLYRGWASVQKKAGPKRNIRGDVPVEITSVSKKKLTYTLHSTGDIAGLMQVDVFPKVSGYLERIHVRIGDSVKQGNLIAEIDPTEFIQKVKEMEAKLGQARAQFAELEAGARPEELRQAEEQVKQAESRFANAKLQKQRIEALYGRQVISKRDMDNAEMEYSVSLAQLEAARQHLRLLREGPRPEVREASKAKMMEMEALLAQEQTKLKHTRVVAPFSGEIARRYVEAGALVSPSTAIVNLVHTATLKVIANVLEKDMSLIRVGMKAEILTDVYPGKIFEGRIARINAALDLPTRTLQAEIYIPNQAGLLKPGMFCTIRVVLLEKPDALLIPKEAVLFENERPYVFVIEGRLARRKLIRLGYEQEGFVEVLEGLTQSESVVVKGQQSLRDGSPVLVLERG